MVQSDVYGEGKQHKSGHIVNLGRLHTAICGVLKEEKGRGDVVCGGNGSTKDERITGDDRTEGEL